MDLELTGKVCVVTGASRGIGLAVVDELVAEGAYVVAGARKVDSLEGRERVTPVAVDLGTPEGPGALVERAIAEHGQVDVLVNNVGAAHARLDGFLAVSDDDFLRSFELNFFAALRATRAVVSHLLSREAPGAIVNVASVNAFFEPDSGVIDYGAAKAALVNVAKSLSQELGPHGIRVNSVSPGPVATDLWLGDSGFAAQVAARTGGKPEDVRDATIAGAMPTGRFTTPREVATLVALLASPRTANATGSSFVIDGGMVKTT